MGVTASKMEMALSTPVITMVRVREVRIYSSSGNI